MTRKEECLMIDRHTGTFWRASIALGLASLLIFANMYYPQPLLPLFTGEFSVSETTASFVISLSLLMLGISFFFISAISDAKGRRKIIVYAMIWGTIATLLIPFAGSFWLLLLLRMVQAVGLAGIPIAAMSYIGEEFTPRAMTVAMGFYVSANSLGGMGGRVMSGVLADWFDWRTAYFFMAGASVLLAVLVILLLPASKNFKPKPLEWSDTWKNALFHLKDPVQRLAYIIGGLNFFVFIGTFNFITYRLDGDPFFVSTAVLGLLFLTYGAGTFSSSLAGELTQRFKQTDCMQTGILIMAGGLLLSLVPQLWVVIASLAVLSFGFFFAHSTSSSWVTKNAKKARASASGLYLTSYYLGGSLSSIYFGLLWPVAGWIGVIAGGLLLLIVTLTSVRRLMPVEAG